jgi:hypothetical protein
VDVVAVAAQLGDLLATGDVDQTNGIVLAGGGQALAVGAERNAVDKTPGRDDRELLVGLDVPEADGLVVGARGQQFAVGAEGYRLRPRVAPCCPRNCSPKPTPSRPG